MPPDLWLHSEGVAISATYHDLSSISPDLLVEKDIVPDSWQCIRFQRTQSQVEINYRQATWRMRERFLWIDVPHDKPWVQESEPDRLIAILATQFLTVHPNLASPDVWFNWELSANVPEPERWLKDHFLILELPSDFQQGKVRPTVSMVRDNLSISVDIDVESKSRGNQPEAESVSFNCQITPRYRLDHKELLEESSHWLKYREMVAEAMEFLLGKGD